jgi:hypothetical protein
LDGYFFTPWAWSRNSFILSAQNLKASSEDPHLLNLSVNPADLLSWATAMTSFVVLSNIITSAAVAPEPVHAPVAPRLIKLMPNPIGTTLVTPLRTGLL